jgi:hypothetical protein
MPGHEVQILVQHALLSLVCVVLLGLLYIRRTCHAANHATREYLLAFFAWSTTVNGPSLLPALASFMAKIIVLRFCQLNFLIANYVPWINVRCQ